MESGALHSANSIMVNPFASIEETSPTSTQEFTKMNPGRKMSLYPMSVKSTDTDFEFGHTEVDSALEHYPREGWIPIQL